MRNPSDLKFPSPFNAERYKAIEEHIDEAIDHADGPVVRVGNTRSGWTLSEVEHVLDKYRAAGWDVIGGDRNCLAILRPRTAPPA
jgi:hypothetical protein